MIRSSCSKEWLAATGVLAILVGAFACATASAGSLYTTRLNDPKAVYLEPSAGADDTTALQQAINRVQETSGQGVVFIGPGRYRLTDTVYSANAGGFTEHNEHVWGTPPNPNLRGHLDMAPEDAANNRLMKILIK